MQLGLPIHWRQNIDDTYFEKIRNLCDTYMTKYLNFVSCLSLRFLAKFFTKNCGFSSNLGKKSIFL